MDMVMNSDDTIRAALTHVSANDRDTWLRMGMAVKSEMGDAGYPVWDEWSQSDDSYIEANARAAWRSIKSNGKITIGTLYHEAQRNGFQLNGHTRPAPYVPCPQQVAKAAADANREAEKRTKAADLARIVLAAAVEARADHPYLERKHVPPVVTLRELPAGEIARHVGYVVKGSGEPLTGRVLIVPVRIGEHLSTLEFIDEAGRKSALKHGAKAGGFWSAQRLPDGDGEGVTLLLAEGVATALSLLSATGDQCFAALSRGMLVQAAKALQQRYAKAKIIICGDLGNGASDAHNAAQAVGGLVVFPDFADGQRHDGGDFNDLAQHAGAEGVLRSLGNATTPEVSTGQAEVANATAAVLEGPKWPDALDEAAFHGIAGEFVRMVEPNTESDPAAILIQFLVVFGALVGREHDGPFYLVERDRHHANLYAVLVGSSAKARKGTSYGRVRDAFKRLPDFAQWKGESKGLSTGEGLIHAVRDAREETKENKHGEMVPEITDAGIVDKRLLVVEPEFARVLRAADRPGNILSAIVRDGWDSGDLRTMTKSDPAKATNAHISIIGHITADELRAELTATDMANGFANRFIFVATKRSKLLPFGGDDADEAEVQALASRLHERIAAARTRNRVAMTPSARAIWETVYPELTASGEGLHAAVTARADAHTVRLALIYCLLDGANMIDAPHLLAALAVCEYCDATAKHIFGASVGDRMADDIARALSNAGTNGLTRTEISGLFKRHQSAERIGQALALLQRRGLADVSTIKTDGRDVEAWISRAPAKKAKYAKEGG